MSINGDDDSKHSGDGANAECGPSYLSPIQTGPPVGFQRRFIGVQLLGHLFTSGGWATSRESNPQNRQDIRQAAHVVRDLLTGPLGDISDNIRLVELLFRFHGRDEILAALSGITDDTLQLYEAFRRLLLEFG